MINYWEDDTPADVTKEIQEWLKEKNK